jgi:glutathione S-transferase
MILIGMFDSPFVRRVGVSMRLLDIDFEHANWSIGRDFEHIREHNPLGRAPTLVLDDGDSLIDSAAILDYLDEQAGNERALLPLSGQARRDAQRLMALATGAADKGIAQVYEKIFRPPEKYHRPWTERCRLQMEAALAELNKWCEARGPSQWLVGERMTQADVTAACVFAYLNEALDLQANGPAYSAISKLSARCEEMPEFSDVKAPFSPPAPY